MVEDRRGLRQGVGAFKALYVILAPDGGLGYYIEAILRGQEAEIPVDAVTISDPDYVSHWRIIPNRTQLVRDPSKPHYYRIDDGVAIRIDADGREVEQYEAHASIYTNALTEGQPAGFLMVWRTDPQSER